MGRVRQAVWQQVARVAARAPVDRAVNALRTVQWARASVEDVQDAMLHGAALPTRQDVRRLQQRVDSLRQRVAQLDLALEALERAEGAGRDAPG